MAKSPAKKEDAPAAAPAAAEAKPARSRRKLFVIIGAAVLVLAVAASGALLLLKQRAATEAAAEEETVQADHEAPVFVNLEAFTANLRQEQGEQFLQAVVTLKLSDQSIAEPIKVYMPELRHRMLMLLSGKRASEISTPEGRESLAEELRVVANTVLYPATGRKPRPAAPAVKPIGNAHAAPAAHRPTPDDPVQGVLFTSFIVQ